jgi:hypothetical protein
VWSLFLESRILIFWSSAAGTAAIAHLENLLFR